MSAKGHAEDWDLDDLWEALESIYPVSITADDLAEDAGDRTQITRDQIVKEILADAHLVYDEREESVGEDSMREIERRVMLSTIGERWPEPSVRDGLPERRHRTTCDGTTRPPSGIPA